MPALPPLVSATELAAHLDDPGVVVLDATVELRTKSCGKIVREPQREAYRAAHIPGAAFADLVELSDPDSPLPLTVPSPTQFATVAGALGIGDGVHVVAYSQGSLGWATRLWWLLRYFGFDAASVLDGGLPAWRAAGLPVQSGEARAVPSTFTPSPRPALLASTAEVERLSRGEAEGTLLSNLSAAVFDGEEGHDKRPPGHIPGSVSLPAAELVDPATGLLLEPAALTARLAALGVEGPVTTYCGAGVAATVGAFALYVGTGADARVYDGSLSAWAADPSRPLVTTQRAGT